jgi:hypothetical protein
VRGVPQTPSEVITDATIVLASGRFGAIFRIILETKQKAKIE